MMKNFYYLLWLIIAVLISQNVTRSQNGFHEVSLKDVLASNQKFVSLESRFAVALPDDVNELTVYTPTQLKLNAIASIRKWSVNEGFIQLNTTQFLNDVPVRKLIDRETAATKARQELASFNAKIVSENAVDTPDGYDLKFAFELSNKIKGLRRYLIVGNRIYVLNATCDPNVPDAEMLIKRVFNIFQALTPDEIEAERNRRIAAASPKPLPQQPTAPKATTDAADEHLKGKVRIIIEESEDFSPDAVQLGKNLDAKVEYDENGMKTKAVYYDKSVPTNIIIYGWLNVGRVEDENYVKNQSEDLNIITSVNPKAKKSKFDSRYSRRYEYKYANGKLAEMRDIMSNGVLWQRTVYSYNGKQRTELIYDEKNKLNQKYVYTLDAGSNTVEQNNAAVSKGDKDEKLFYSYEFDNQKNWTKRTASKQVTENGQLIFKKTAVAYRTITYFE